MVLLLLQLWVLIGMLKWSSVSVSLSSASSTSVSEIRPTSSKASLWASTRCPSPAWRKVSHKPERVTWGGNEAKGEIISDNNVDCHCISSTFTVSALLKVILCSVNVYFFMEIMLMHLTAIHTNIDFTSLFLFHLQAIAGFLFGPETNAAWIQLHCLSLSRTPKNSYRTPSHTDTNTLPTYTEASLIQEQQ